jgi:hypothetical protein
MTVATPQIPPLGWNTIPASAPSLLNEGVFGGSWAVAASRFLVNKQYAQIFFRFFVQYNEKYFSQNT